MAEAAARKAGYPSVEDRNKVIEETERIKTREKKEQVQKDRAEHRRRKAAPIAARVELEKLLASQEGHGDRVRGAIRDRELGEKIVREHNKTTRRILELRKMLKELEKY